MDDRRTGGARVPSGAAAREPSDRSPAGALFLSGRASLAAAAAGTWSGFAIEAAIVLALGAVAEELFFRGFMLGAIRLRTGSLPAAMVAHLALNWTQVAVLHAPLRGLPLAAPPGYAWTSSGPAWLTGGTAGIEGSVATAACLFVVTFLVLRTARPATRRPRA